jgi:UDP-N-acetylmuramyl pentapeptide synthase
MHELGDESELMHREIGILAGELRIDHLVVIGERSYISTKINPATSVHFYEDQNGTEELFDRFEAGDVILVKASRAEHLEITAEKILTTWRARMGVDS